MTPDARKRLELDWPALAARLNRYLAARGVPVGRRDDLIQETAARVVAMAERVDPGMDPWPLTKTIALNLIRDESRRRYSEIPSPIPDRPHPFEADAAGLARVELSRVAAALNGMSATHRAALLAEAGEGTVESRGPDADKMVRMRARRRLRDLLGGLPAGIPARLRAEEVLRWLGGAKDGLLGSLACVACVAAYPGAGFTFPPRLEVAEVQQQVPSSVDASPDVTMRSATREGLAPKVTELSSGRSDQRPPAAEAGDGRGSGGGTADSSSGPSLPSLPGAPNGVPGGDTAVPGEQEAAEAVAVPAAPDDQALPSAPETLLPIQEVVSAALPE